MTVSSPASLVAPAASRPVRGFTLALASGLLGLTLQAAQAQQAPDRRNMVAFSSSATQEVAQDLMTVTLQAQKEGPQAAEVQAALKQQLEAALSEARVAARPDLMDVRTGGFSIHPRYNNQGRIIGWQGQAQLQLQGTDMGRIAQTAGRLNALNIVQVNYGLSRALRQRFEAELTAQAIQAFRGKAQDTAKAFGFANYTLGEVHIQSTEPGFEGRPVPMLARAVMADAASAPLPVEPGKGSVTVTVSGHVFLAP